jgi:AcrR family transcriptional regulator
MAIGDDSVTAARLTRKGRATRERIVTAAAELMFANGVANTSTEDVQRRAGVSTSQIYHYFTDKRSLIRAVIAHQTEAVLGAQEAFLSQLDSLEALRAWRDFAVEVQRQNNCTGGCPIGSLVSELAEHDPDARLKLAEGFSRWESSIRDGLRAMYARGELQRQANPEQLAIALLAAVQGGLLLTQLNRTTAPLEAAMTAMIDHIGSLTVTAPPGPERYLPEGSAR